MTADRYLKPDQVAKLLQVSEKTVHRWASQDASLPVLRLGGGKGKRSQLRFPEDRLAAWLRSREQGIGQPRAKKLAPSGPAASGQVRDLASVRAGDGTAGHSSRRAMGQPMGQQARKEAP